MSDQSIGWSSGQVITKELIIRPLTVWPSGLILLMSEKRRVSV